VDFGGKWGVCMVPWLHWLHIYPSTQHWERLMRIVLANVIVSRSISPGYFRLDPAGRSLRAGRRD
jgi:hypothetical protein